MPQDNIHPFSSNFNQCIFNNVKVSIVRQYLTMKVNKILILSCDKEIHSKVSLLIFQITLWHFSLSQLFSIFFGEKKNSFKQNETRLKHYNVKK